MINWDELLGCHYGKARMRSMVSRIRTASRSVMGSELQTDAKVKAWMARHAQRYVGDLAKLRRAAHGNTPNRRTIQHHLLGSHSGRVCSVLLAAAKRSRKMTMAEVDAFAASIRPWRDCGEPIHGVPLTKSDGSIRWTVSFGVRRLALSYLCRDILAACWGPMIHEMNAKGCGVEYAIKLLVSDINNDRPWVGLGDIKNFFPSIGHEGLIRLVPLPESVVRHSLIISKDKPILLPFGSSHSVNSALRQGLPQGSPASSVIASRMTWLAIEPLCDEVGIWSYADNLFWACDSKKLADATLDALITGFQTHPAGELKLHKTSVTHTDEGVDLFGYNVRTFDYHDNWWAIARPTPGAFDHFFARLGEALKFVETDDLVDVAFERTSNWIKSRSAWNPTADGMDVVLDRGLKLAMAEIKLRQALDLAA